MVTVRRIGAFLALTLGLSTLGCILGFMVGNLVRSGTVVNWRPLGAPPEQSVAFERVVQERPDFVV